MNPLPILPFSDFTEASTAALAFLGKTLHFNLWMVTRTEGNDWIVLSRDDHGYGVGEGDVFKWSDTFCSLMVEDRGPRVVPKVADFPPYQNQPIARQIQIGAYFGIPLQRADGSLFGTLCAVHPTEMPDDIRHELALVELVGRMLSTILAKDLDIAESRRLTERAEGEAMRDGLTGLYNRRGWDYFLASEEDRCRRYGNPACVMVIDLDGLKKINDTEGHDAGDVLIRRAADALRAATRVSDVVARIGGDEFCILCVETNAREAEKLTHRLKEAFTEHQVMASMGFAMRHPKNGMEAAWKQADQAMYEAKRRR